MKRLWLVLALAIVAMPVVAEALQAPRLQTQINIQINVTNPLGRVPVPQTLDDMTPSIGRLARAESLQFTGSQVIAQAQKAVRVEAAVTPNPNATTLYTDQTSLVVNATAGQTVTLTCPYHVIVQSSTIASWLLKDGLYTDWTGSNGSSFPGGAVARDYYVSTPTTAPVAFAVYTSNANNWVTVTTGSYSKTYCVDLQLNVPTSALTGTYTSNAIYTLYY